MKKIITLIAMVIISVSIFAQAPNKMSYQAVIRNSLNTLVANSSVGMQISVLQGSPSGSTVYVETQTPTTNANGLASIEIGGGTILSGNFSAIDWAEGPFFIKTETDPAGGTNYTITNINQLLSVPYALFSGNGIIGVSANGDTLYLGNGSHLIIPGISAVNSGYNHSCGATDVHNPSKTYGTMTDQQGNVYKTIVIGSQEWMAENLKTTIYRNGNEISNVTGESPWLNLTTGAWCYQQHFEQYDCPYGKLYNWYAVTDPRNLCPAGWHVPTDSEWSILINHLDPNADGGEISNMSGGKLKSLHYWTNPNQDASNESGFSGIQGGYRINEGTFNGIDEFGTWWSSTAFDETYALFRYLTFSSGSAYRSSNYKQAGLSVRCLKD